MALGLVVARLWEEAGKGKNQRHGVVGNRVGVGNLGAGQSHACAAEGGLVVLVHAGADGLHEAQARRGFQDGVVP